MTSKVMSAPDSPTEREPCMVGGGTDTAQVPGTQPNLETISTIPDEQTATDETSPVERASHLEHQPTIAANHRFVSIVGRDHLTIEHVLATFSDEGKYKTNHIQPIQQAYKTMWKRIQEHELTGYQKLFADKVALVQTTRQLLLDTGFVSPPADIHNSHLQYGEYLDLLIEGREELERTTGFLALLMSEIRSYGEAWNYFWDMIDNIEESNEHSDVTEIQHIGDSDDQNVEQTSEWHDEDWILDNLYNAMRRFYFLFDSVYYSYMYAVGRLDSDPPDWLEWDCEAWRNEHWEFHDVSMDDMMQDMKIEAGDEESDEDENGKEKKDSNGSDSEEDWVTEEAAQEALAVLLESVEHDSEYELVLEVNPVELSERDWLTQQMGDMTEYLEVLRKERKLKQRS